MRQKAFPSIIVALLTLSAFIFTGCDKVPELPVLGSPFNNFWTSDDGQIVRVMGYADGHQVGSHAVFQVQFDNPLQNVPTWSDGYRVVLFDQASGNEWEIAHGEFNVQTSSMTQFPVTVQFPQGVEGQLCLNVITASGGGLGVQIQVGEKDPDIIPTAISSLS